MKNMRSRTEKGFAIICVVVIALILSILGYSLLSLAASEITLSRKEVDRTKAFYLAEAGLADVTIKLHNKDFTKINETKLGDGTYNVDIYLDKESPYVISWGIVGTEEKIIKAEMSFLARPYEDAIFAGNASLEDFIFSLRGKGNPQSTGGRLVGGKDMVRGNVYANGDVSLYEESSINPSPSPNTFSLNGDVDATGNINILDSASISGDKNKGVSVEENPDLAGMNYSVNNTHNVSAIFAAKGITSGRLPTDDPLREIVVKNPSDRSAECGTTTNDDYFLEPTSFIAGSNQTSAATPLNLGENRIYYIDGDVWIHSPKTYGFLIDGKVTIVATGDIHISDNTKYANSQSLVGLVALGKYDSQGQLTSGGNIYFGDPRFGTTYTVSGLMFAANDFLYNTDSVTRQSAEPTTGFTVNGNFAALNHVSINRDWYTDSVTKKARPAHFDSVSGRWLDIEDGSALSSGEISGLRHYQMQVNYDERVRNAETQPPGLPKGGNAIFAGLIKWAEL